MVLRTTLLCLALTLASCSRHEASVEERRRELLKPQDREKMRAELKEKMRLYDDDGALLPSGEEVAGVPLPRGLKMIRDRGGLWYFETRVRFDALTRFFRARLFTGRIDQSEDGGLTFVRAIPVHRKDVAPVDVVVEHKRDDHRIAYVRIRQPGVPRKGPLPAEVEARAKVLREAVQ